MLKTSDSSQQKASKRRTQEHIQGRRNMIIITLAIRLNHVVSVKRDEERKETKSTIKINVVQCLVMSEEIIGKKWID